MGFTIFLRMDRNALVQILCGIELLIIRRISHKFYFILRNTLSVFEIVSSQVHRASFTSVSVVRKVAYRFCPKSQRGDWCVLSSCNRFDLSSFNLAKCPLIYLPFEFVPNSVNVNEVVFVVALLVLWD